MHFLLPLKIYILEWIKKFYSQLGEESFEEEKKTEYVLIDDDDDPSLLSTFTSYENESSFIPSSNLSYLLIMENNLLLLIHFFNMDGLILIIATSHMEENLKTDNQEWNESEYSNGELNDGR